MVRWRFIKFGLVGASGTVVNVAVLYLAQEFLFSHIADFHVSNALSWKSYFPSFQFS